MSENSFLTLLSQTVFHCASDSVTSGTALLIQWASAGLAVQAPVIFVTHCAYGLACIHSGTTRLRCCMQRYNTEDTIWTEPVDNELNTAQSITDALH